ncbi:MFS transporter [Acidisoma sp. 7E03]
MHQHESAAVGWRQSVILLTGSCLPVLGAVLLGPVLPDIQRHFHATPGVAILTPLTLTLPALMIGLFSFAAGAMIDRFGRRGPLLVALLLYGLFGCAPLLLDDLHAILATRGVLGVMEAVIMTTCTTLIGDYFAAGRRRRLLALQGGIASFSATVFFAIGGALGEFGWRTPFWLYASAIVMLPLCWRLLPEPTLAPATARVDAKALGAAEPMRTPWGVLLTAYPFALVTGIALLMIPVQAGYLFNQMGVTSPAVIGLTSAANQGAVCIGALLTRRFLAAGFGKIFFIGFATAGLGLVLVAQVQTPHGLIAGGVINGFGCGVLLVGLLTWTLENLPVAVRGRGTGGFQACIFLGEFLSPLVVFALRGLGFGLAPTLGVCGLVMLLLTLFAIAAPMVSVRSTAASSPHAH